MAYKTTDGKIFDNYQSAQWHQDSIDAQKESLDRRYSSNASRYVNDPVGPRLLNMAIDANDAGNCDQAIDYINRYLADNKPSTSQLVQIHNSLGVAYFKKGNREKAIENFKLSADYAVERNVDYIGLDNLKNMGIEYTPQRRSVSNSSSASSKLNMKHVPDNFTGKGAYLYLGRDVYEGDWVKEEPHGKGKMIYKNGDVYEGDWVKGNRQGNGKLTYKGGGGYEGSWHDDDYHGKGKWSNSKGDMYEGNFRKGYRHGKGKLTQADGKVEDGNWKDGEFKGKGLFG